MAWGILRSSAKLCQAVPSNKRQELDFLAPGQWLIPSSSFAFLGTMKLCNVKGKRTEWVFGISDRQWKRNRAISTGHNHCTIGGQYLRLNPSSVIGTIHALGPRQTQGAKKHSRWHWSGTPQRKTAHRRDVAPRFVSKFKKVRRPYRKFLFHLISKCRVSCKSLPRSVLGLPVESKAKNSTELGIRFILLPTNACTLDLMANHVDCCDFWRVI